MARGGGQLFGGPVRMHAPAASVLVLARVSFASVALWVIVAAVLVSLAVVGAAWWADRWRDPDRDRGPDS